MLSRSEPLDPARPSLDALPTDVSVTIEVVRGGRVKWGAGGGIDFVSPVACPFAYGSVLGIEGGDGDPADAVVLGGPWRRGQVVPTTVWGRVCFVDGGALDDKWICGPQPPSPRELTELRRFFSAYAVVKRAAGRFRGRRGPSSFQGVELRVGGPRKLT